MSPVLLKNGRQTFGTRAMDANFSLRMSGFCSLRALSAFARDWSSLDAFEDDERERSSPAANAAGLDSLVESPDQLRLLSRLHSSASAQSTPLLPRDRLPDNYQPKSCYMINSSLLRESADGANLETRHRLLIVLSCSFEGALVIRFGGQLRRV